PRPVRLTPKAYGVLDYLARHSERIVPKHELLDQVWAGVYVGRAGLKVAIRESRSALKDDSTAPRFVLTARRIGYRFVAPVSSEEPAQPPPTDDIGRSRAVGGAPLVPAGRTQ